ncbi:hypothetical protein D3C86_1768690 [compost metagenome]
MKKLANSTELAISGNLTGDVSPVLPVKLITFFPAVPFLVVTKITPYAALDPYIADADASFNTEMLSISLGLISANDISIPSTST